MPAVAHENPTKENLRNVFECTSDTCSFFVVNYKKEAVYEFESTLICPECGDELKEKSIDDYLKLRYGKNTPL